jgi:hypothetical protein
MSPFWRDLLVDCLVVLLVCAAGAALLLLTARLVMGAPLVIVDGVTLCHASGVEYRTGMGHLVIDCGPIVFTDGFEGGSGVSE